MKAVLLVAFALLLSATTLICSAQTSSSRRVLSTRDSAEAQKLELLIKQYAESVNNLDLALARKVWSSAPEVTFIHPRGTEYGLEAVLQNFYGSTMGTFSKRELLLDRAAIHVYGDTAWSEFQWTFHATVKNGGPDITTQGRESQVYHKENGAWHIVLVHYSGMPVTAELKGF